MSKTYARSFQIALLLLIGSAMAHGQCANGWVRQGGGAETDFARSMAVDGSGNIYATGSFTNAAVFSGVSVTSPDGAEDVFLAKYAPDGALLWIRSGGGPNIDYPGRVAVDGQGNAYITGTHFRPAVFGGINLPNAAAQPNAFVVKYDPDGAVMWAITLGGDGWDTGDAIAFDATSGHVIVGGQFEGTAQFGGLSATAASQRDLYVAEVDADGQVDGLSGFGQNTGNEQVGGLAVGADGSVIAVCIINGTITVDGSPYASTGYYDCMLVKYAPGLLVEWARFGGSILDDFWNDVAIGANGDVFASGVVSANAVFGTETLAGAGDKDQVLAKYSADGDLEWIRGGGGQGTDAGGEVVVLDNGHALITGSFQGTAAFGGTTVTAAGTSDIVMVEYDGTGLATDVAHWGAEGNNFGYGAAQGPFGAVYIAGQFEGAMNIGDTLIQASGGRDAFIHQVCEGTVGITETATDPGLCVRPVPNDGHFSVVLNNAEGGPALLRVLDSAGRVVHQRSIVLRAGSASVDLELDLVPGTYAIELIGARTSARRMMVVAR